MLRAANVTPPMKIQEYKQKIKFDQNSFDDIEVYYLNSINLSMDFSFSFYFPFYMIDQIMCCPCQLPFKFYYWKI